MKNFFIVCFFSFSLFFSGCGKNEEQEKVPEIPVVEVQEVVKETFSPDLSLSGTIAAHQEITVAAEISGTVAHNLVKEGDLVQAGQVLMQLEPNTNLASVSYEAATVGFANAQATLSLTQNSTEKDIQNARIAMEQAEIAYARSKKTKNFTQDAAAAQAVSAEKGLEIAKKNLDIAKTSLTQTEERESKTIKNLLENSSNSLSNALTNFRTSLTMVDETLGISAKNEGLNDAYEAFIGAKDPSLILPTKTTWKTLNADFANLEKDFRDFEKISYTAEDEAKLQDFLNRGVLYAKELRKLQRNLETILQNSIDSPVFSQVQINALKNSLTGLQNGLEGHIAGLSGAEQALSDFHVQSPQRIENAKLNISVLESQVATAEEQLRNIQNNKGLSIINSDTEEENAAKNLEAAKNAYEAAQSRADLSLQSAQAQFDSARAALDQAMFNISKLTIVAGTSGTITKIDRHDGDTVAPGTPLMTVSDFSVLKMVTDVSVSESFALDEGMEVDISAEGIADSLKGKIQTIYPSADSVTRRVRVDIALDNQKGVPANIFATAKIHLPPEPEAMFIPVSSLVSENPDSVFVVEVSEDGKSVVKEKKVTMGRKERDLVEILEGLSVGEKILSKKYSGLKEGDEVVVK